MKRFRVVTMVAMVSVAVAACAPLRSVPPPPRALEPSELALVYDRGLEMQASGTTVARGHEYDGLEQHVACVPVARYHARHAESYGQAGTALTIAGGTAGVAGLGGLGGLAFLDDDPELAAGFLVTGLAVAATGVVLAAVGRSFKSRAHGHAIDAMNHYNDEVGSRGGACVAPR